METVKIKIRRKNGERRIGNVVRLTNEARDVLQKMMNDNNMGATELISEIIIQVSPNVEFVDW